MLVVLLSIVLSLLACSFVGLRMLSLARRTRKLPELCMGLGLSAFALAQVSRLALGGLDGHLAPQRMLDAYLFMQVGYLLTQIGICLFTATSLLVLLLLGLYLQGITLMDNSLAASVLVTGSGLVMAVVPWLTFAPPGAYLRFVRQRAEQSGAGEA